MKPRFPHDCPHCTFIVHHYGVDVYWCSKDDYVEVWSNNAIRTFDVETIASYACMPGTWEVVARASAIGAMCKADADCLLNGITP